MRRIYCIIILITALLCISSISKSQNNRAKSDDLGRIILNTYISDKIVNLPNGAKRLLSSRITKIASRNGLGGKTSNPRFIITPNINILTKDITPTAPPMIAMTLEVSVYVGDGIDGTMFASESIEVKGIGTNENKAYIAAIKQIKAKNPAMQRLIRNSKEKIVEYYNSRCDFILSEAKALEGREEFDLAIIKLTSVPDVCRECFDRCMEAVTPIYQKQIDKECLVNLSKAKIAWNAGLDINAANNAKVFIANINPNASSYYQVTELFNLIAKRIKEVDSREWDFKLKQDQDKIDIKKAKIKTEDYRIAANKEIKLNNNKTNLDISKARIAANKELSLNNNKMNLDISKARIAANKAVDLKHGHAITYDVASWW